MERMKYSPLVPVRRNGGYHLPGDRIRYSPIVKTGLALLVGASILIPVGMKVKEYMTKKRETPAMLDLRYNPLLQQEGFNIYPRNGNLNLEYSPLLKPVKKEKNKTN